MGKLLRRLFSVSKFEARPTPAIVFWADALVMAPALIIWGSVVVITFGVLAGSWWVILAIPIWAVAFFQISRYLHRTGRLRIDVAVYSTATVMLATLYVYFFAPR